MKRIEQKGIEQEHNPQKGVLEGGECLTNISLRVSYSLNKESFPIQEAAHKNGGLVRMPVLSGDGRSTFEWVFAGNAKSEIDARVTSDTCDPAWNSKWSLGTNTMSIETKLRKHKLEEGYKEPERRGGKRK